MFAIKGASTKHRPIIGKPTAQDVKRNGQVLKGGVMVWPVGTDTAKDRIFGALTADEDRELAERRLHFSEDLPDEYFEQLCAEAYNPSKDRWDRLRKRNEALDLMVYNFACAYHPRLRLNAYQDADWMALEVVIEPRVKDLFSAAAENVESEPSRAAEERPAPAETAENALSAGEPALEVAVAASVADPPTQIVVQEAAPSWVPRRDNWLRR